MPLTRYTPEDEVHICVGALLSVILQPAVGYAQVPEGYAGGGAGGWTSPYTDGIRVEVRDIGRRPPVSRAKTSTRPREPAD